MIHQRLLLQAIQGREPVLVAFVERIAPKILEHFATMSALGGSGKPRPVSDLEIPPTLRRYTAEELARFGASNPDQSMATHILNGIFAGMRLAEKLPASKAMNADEKRLWILGYVVHDYTKVYGLQVPAGELPAIRQLVARLGERLNFGTFLTNWEHWLDDVVWLGQNTQTREGANLNTRDFPNLRTAPRRLEVLRMLSSYADVLVHIKSPSEVVISPAEHQTAENLREKLAILFGAEHAPRLAYHKLTEVRGLLSNVINNAMMDTLAKQGYEPYLFFPNGVVYLTQRETQESLSADQVADDVWQRAVQIVGESDFGIQRMGTGFIPSSALQELVGMDGVLETGRRQAINTFVSHSESRLYGFYTGKSDNDLKEEYADTKLIKQVQSDFVKEKGLPADLRVDRLGEFLTFAYRTIRESFKKAPDVTPTVLGVLGLEHITREEATRQKGGTYFGWFYVAARYVQQNPTKDDNDIDDLMREIGERISRWIKAENLLTRTRSSVAEKVKDYVAGLIEMNGKPLRNSLAARSSEEFRRYSESKEKHKSVCSLCSSPFESVVQETAEVPFGNQQYSNKNPLATGLIQRGICPVCRVEMILRRIQQEDITEDDKPVQVFIYPTYFFTPETAFVVKTFRDRFEDIAVNPTGLLKHLRAKGFTVGNLLRFEEFLAEPSDSPSLKKSFKYHEEDQAALFFFPIKPAKPRGRQLTDTDQWAMPVFYALALPLLLDAKVVVSASFVPIYATGADFRSTAILDGPHSFTKHVLKREQFRVDEIEEHLLRLLELYDLHCDVFAERTDLHWPQLNAIAKDVATDPYYVFSYFEKRQRREKPKKEEKGRPRIQKKIPTLDDVGRYIEIYEKLGGELTMGFIGKLVDAYAKFYEADDFKSDYNVLKPFDLAMSITIDSDPQTQREDLVLQIAGTIDAVMDRIRRPGQKVGGRDPIWRDTTLTVPERLAKSRKLIEEFASLFLDRAFDHYCSGNRAILRERRNRLRAAANFYYLSKYGYTKKEETNG